MGDSRPKRPPRCIRNLLGAGGGGGSERPIADAYREFHSERRAFSEPEWGVADLQRGWRRDRSYRAILPKLGNERAHGRHMPPAQGWYVSFRRKCGVTLSSDARNRRYFSSS